MPLHLCALLFSRVQQTLQKVHHHDCMVRQLLISREIVDVHNQKVGTFTTCERHSNAAVSRWKPSQGTSYFECTSVWTMSSVMQSATVILQHLASNIASACKQKSCKPAGVAHHSVKGTCMLHNVGSSLMPCKSNSAGNAMLQ